MDRPTFSPQSRIAHLPKRLFRLCFIIVNNLYCIPTYIVWMMLLAPLRILKKDVFWKIEGQLFHWLLAMVSMWSWWAGYDVVEAGDDIEECINDRTLVIANHQSTGDVPFLMSTFNARRQILPNIMWIIDSLFKYTNFGIISVIHQDFFIRSGKAKRDESLKALINHIQNSYIPRKRKWMVLFPEGGFLRKRKAISQSYAEKNNLPRLEYVSLPRVGALHVIMDTVGPDAVFNNNSSGDVHDDNLMARLKWILDITIAYPNGDPVNLGDIVFGTRPPCKVIVFYRLYPIDRMPHDPEGMTKWLFDRWEEKEQFLDIFYKTGEFPFGNPRKPPQVVEQDFLRFIILHIFFLLSTYFHVRVFIVLYQYINYLVY